MSVPNLGNDHRPAVRLDKVFWVAAQRHDIVAWQLPGGICQTSVNAPTEPPARIAYSTNWLSTPAVSVPAMTERAPAQSTAVTEPNTSTITNAVRVERTRMRRRAVSSTRATASPQRCASWRSRA